MNKEQDSDRLTISPVTAGTRIVAGVSIVLIGGACAFLGLFLATYGEATSVEIVRSIFFCMVPGIVFLLLGLYILFKRYDVITFNRSTGELTIRKWKLKSEKQFTYSLSDIEAVELLIIAGGEYSPSQTRLELLLRKNTDVNRPKEEKLVIGPRSKAVAEKVAAFLNVPLHVHNED
jgi:hypothetical protein